MRGIRSGVTSLLKARIAGAGLALKKKTFEAWAYIFYKEMIYQERFSRMIERTGRLKA